MVAPPAPPVCTVLASAIAIIFCVIDLSAVLIRGEAVRARAPCFGFTFHALAGDARSRPSSARHIDLLDLVDVGVLGGGFDDGRQGRAGRRDAVRQDLFSIELQNKRHPSCLRSENTLTQCNLTNATHIF